MNNLKAVMQKLIPGSRLQKCLEGIGLPSEAGIEPAIDHYCPYCLKEKFEFIHPDTESLRPLACECERHFFMLKEYIHTCTDDWALKQARETFEAMTKLRADNHRALLERMGENAKA